MPPANMARRQSESLANLKVGCFETREQPNAGQA